MTFRKLTRPGRLHAVVDDDSRFSDSRFVEVVTTRRSSDWREAARSLASRLMPVMVLAAATVLGLAAVALV